MSEDEEIVELREFVVDRLKRRISVPDERFDEVFPIEWRERSRRFWTPVEVALRAASWFSESDCRRVLDVGSGVGKMCIVGTLCSDIVFAGIEQRGPLVRVAREAASFFGVGTRISFTEATVDAMNASAFEAFYLYNPFQENLYSDSERLDSSVELSEARFARDIRLVEEILRAAPIGAHVITYHGFGGHVPNSFAPERSLRIGSDVLRLWVKRRQEATGYYVETGPAGREIVVAPRNVSGR